MKLNIGCGKKVLSGWVNVDAVSGPGVDFVAEMGDLPLDENSCSEIMAVHVLEHLYPWDAEKAIAECSRVLMPGGQLALELPDFHKCCVNIAKQLQHPKHPDLLGLFGLFGDPKYKDPYMIHRWGYTPETLSDLLSRHGFCRIRQETPLYHAAGRHQRDMRIVCNKPEM